MSNSVFDSDVSLKVQAAFGYRSTSTAPVWTDLSTSVRSIKTQRGRVSVLNRFDAGSAQIVLNNDDAAFDPGNTASAHYPNILVNVPIRVQAIHSGSTYSLWRGVADSWPPEYQDVGQHSVTNLTAVEDFAVISRTVVASTVAQELTHTRIGALLDDANWDTDRRDLDTGLSLQAASTLTPTANVLTLAKDAADSEAGTLWMSGAGDVTFRNRVKFQDGVTASSTFGPSALPYTEVVPAYDADYLYNDVRVTRNGGTVQTGQSTASIDSHGVESLAKATDQSNDNEALNTAEWMADTYGVQQVRVDQLTVRPRSDTGMWEPLLSADFDTVWKVKVDPPGSGTVLDTDVVVQGIRHTITPMFWETVIDTRTLSTTETDAYWVVGTSTLDGKTRLA